MPLVPLAPTTSSSDRPLTTVPRRSRNGSPLVTTVRACHPARFSAAAPRLSSFKAAFSLPTFLRFTSRATAWAPGTRRRDGMGINSTVVRRITRPSLGGNRPATNESARFDVADPSIPSTIRRTRTGRLTTSTAHLAPRTMPRDTLPIRTRRIGPWPRHPSTMASALNRLASPRMPSTGVLSTTTASTSGQRPDSVRRARSAAASAVRSSAVRRIDRRYSARVLSATTTRTRVSCGHGKFRAVVSAALACADPSVATRTRNGLGFAIAVSSFDSRTIATSETCIRMRSGPSRSAAEHPGPHPLNGGEP
jgi:hypothetical protein